MALQSRQGPARWWRVLSPMSHVGASPDSQGWGGLSVPGTRGHCLGAAGRQSGFGVNVEMGRRGQQLEPSAEYVPSIEALLESFSWSPNGKQKNSVYEDTWRAATKSRSFTERRTRVQLHTLVSHSPGDSE